MARSVATDLVHSALESGGVLVQEVAAAPPGTYESAEGAGEEFVDQGRAVLERGIQKAEELQASVLRLGDPSASAADLSGDAVDLLDAIDGVVSFVREVLGMAKRQHAAINVQELQLSQRTEAERALAKYVTCALIALACPVAMALTTRTSMLGIYTLSVDEIADTPHWAKCL